MRRTNWIYALMIGGCAAMLAGCQDDFLSGTMPAGSGQTVTRAYTALDADGENTGGLKRYTDGSKVVWKATRRVPLTGVGRTIGNMNKGLVNVLGGQNDFNALLDYDPTNTASLAGVAAVDAVYNQLISVKDLYRTYAGGQKAGFVYSADTETITLDVLKLFTIMLYNDGTLVETIPAVDASGLLNLGLLNLSTADGVAQQAVVADVPDDIEFDEVALACGQVADLSVLGAMKLYYAFVGETPERTTVKDDAAFDAHPYGNAVLYPQSYSASWNNWADRDGLLTASTTDNPCVEVVGGLLNWLAGGYRVTVDLGEEVPAGTEVGVRYTQGNVLSLTVGSTASLYTYLDEPSSLLQESEDYAEKYQTGGLLGASLIGGGKGANSFIASKPFRYLFFNVIGLDVNLGTTSYNYVYTRAQTTTDATSYFNIPERTDVPTSSFRFLKPDEGNVSLEIVSQPAGASATLVDGLRVSGMTVDGEYTVKATYTATDGTTFVQTCVLNRVTDTTQGDSSCNQYITAAGHGAYVTSPLDGTGGLLCLLCNATDAEKANLLDGNINTYLGTMQAVDLIGNQSVVAVKLNTPMQVDNGGYRAGFIMQVNNELLSLSALNYLYVKLYNGTQEIATQVSGSRPTVDLGLLNGQSNKVRIGVEAPAGSPAFDRIELYNAGILTLNLSSIRLYEVFYEPASAQNCSSSGISEACMELVTPATYGAHINYDYTKITSVLDVASGMYSLDHVLDADQNTAATLPLTSVLSETSLAVGFNTMPAGQSIGVILQDMTGIGDVKLLSGLKFEVYNDGNLVTDYQKENDESLGSGVLSVSLIGHEGKVYLEITPDAEFDEIRLSAGSVAGVLNDLLVYGVYTRVDADGDGIPDCLPDDPGEGSTKPVPRVSSIHICEGDPFSIPVWGGTEGETYTLTFQQYENEKLETKVGTSFGVQMTLNNNTLTPATGQQVPAAGVYLADFGSEAADYKNLPVYIHPTQSTWLGTTAGNETEWNLWTNWSAGTPWGCTDVVIPGGLAHYPVLRQGGDYNCARIQFASDDDMRIGEVVNTHYLTYDRAWVDVKLSANTYYMLTAPLKNTYTGDIFGMEAYDTRALTRIAGDYNYQDAWLTFDAAHYPLDANFRFTPRVYQHLFGGFTYNVTNEGTASLKPGDQNWTAPFNLVAQRYQTGTGFLVKMGDYEAAASYTLRLPKLYPTYEYYSTDGQLIPGKTESVERSAGAGERFIYEDENNRASFPMHILLQNDRPGDTWLAGNPFMAHIDLEAFFEANVAVGAVKVLRRAAGTQADRYVTIARDGAASAAVKQIAPMEGFLVVLRPPYSEQNRYKTYIHFTEAMLVASDGTATRAIRR